MTQEKTQPASSRLRSAALRSIGDEGRAELVTARLIQTISAGAFVQGERLPPETELAELLGVAIITVREALSTLRERGWIHTRRGRQGGSFVRPSHDELLLLNAQALSRMPRLELADLGVHNQVISAACGEFACARATPAELDAVLEALEGISQEENPQTWRRQITDVQLELAALSQSVRLTHQHIRVHTECIPLFSLQDTDADRRRDTHELLVQRVRATLTGNVSQVREIVATDVRQTMRWLMRYRQELIASPGAPANISLR